MGHKKFEQVGNFLYFYQYEYNLVYRFKRHKNKKYYTVPYVYNKKNATIKKNKFYKLVLSNLRKTKEFPDNPYFVTLTFADYVTDVKNVWLCFKEFNRNLKKTNLIFKYIAVPEYHKNGSYHLHCIYWGLNNILKYERNLRQIQNIWLYGFIDSLSTDGSDKIAGYLAKYMQKQFVSNIYNGQKAYACSKNVLRSLSTKIKTAYHFFKDEAVEKGSLISEGGYKTHWLGHCSYQVYSYVIDH